MCHFTMGLTHCYKTTVFLHLSELNDEKYIKQFICNMHVAVHI